MMDDPNQDDWTNQNNLPPYLGMPTVNGYDPGPNWNGGVAPGPPDPRYDWNGGSPVDAPLEPGHGWEWQHPSGNNDIHTPTWNVDNKQWDYGSWNQKLGGGLGYTPAPQGGGGSGPAPTGGGGYVPSITPSGGGGGGTTGITVPPAGLPQNILDLFNTVPQKTPIQTAYQDALLKYMQRGFETPSLDDSILGPQTEVFRAANQRNTERQRRTAVERASAVGQNQSGYLDNLINEGVQKQGFNNAQFNANLLGTEMGKRREELQAALQLARATGDAEAARELQARLAQVSAALQQEGLNLQGQLGMGDLALRNRQTDIGNSQFYDNLGVNTALNLENLNQSALQKILSGLNP